MIIGLPGAEAIERCRDAGEQAADRRQDKERRAARKSQYRGKNESQQECCQRHGASPEAVRQQSDRVLHCEPGDHCRGDEGRDRAGTIAEPLEINRNKRVERAVREAGGEAADHAERRDAEQPHQPEMRARPERRIGLLSERHGQERGRERHADCDEQQSGTIDQVERQRPGGAAAPGRDQIRPESPAPRRRVSLVVEPALGNQEQARHGIADDQPEQRPNPGRLGEGQQQGRIGRDRGEDGKGADMADARHDPVDREGARKEPHEIGRSHQTDERRRHRVPQEQQRDQRRHHAKRHLGADDAEQHRRDRG